MTDLLVELQGAAVAAMVAGSDDGGAAGMSLAKKALCLVSAFEVFGEEMKL